MRTSSDDLIGDCLGMESCFDMSKNGDDLGIQTDFSERRSGKRDQRRKTEKKEFPPPLSLLAWREDSPSFNTPWVLKRYQTDDGRLILREEKVWHHRGYFRVNRSNGRLTLQLFLLDDVVFEGDQENHEEEEEETEKGDNSFEEEIFEREEEKESAAEEGGSATASGVGVKCMDCNCPCFVRMPVLAIRTV